MSWDNCFCDYDPPEFWSKSIRKARKPHACYECGGPIKPGETHEYVSGKWDGMLDWFRTCERCVDLRQWMTNNVPCFCWAHGNLFDDAQNTVEDAYRRAPNEVRGLNFGFLRRRVLIDRRNAEARRS